MAMNVNLPGIIAEPVEVFVAIRTTEATPVALPLQAVVDSGGNGTWKYLGATKKKSTKIGGDPLATEIHDGTESQKGMKIVPEFALVQTDSTNITLVETFLDCYVDILFRVLGTFKYHRVKKVQLVHGVALSFAYDEANSISVRAPREAKKLTDAYDQGTLAAS
jgi:hypothetical protein